MAIDALTKTLEYEPDSADILHERSIVNFKFKDLRAAVRDFSTRVKLDRGNKSTQTYLVDVIIRLNFSYNHTDELELLSLWEPNLRRYHYHY